MNNPRNRILIFLVIFLLLTNITMLLYILMKPPVKGNRPDWRGPGITAFLQHEAGFSKTQMEMLDSLKKQHRATMKPLFADLGRSKDSFYSLLGKPNTPDSVLEASAAVIGRKQAALDLHFFRNFLSIRNLCTPTQLLKFDSAMPSLAARMMQPWRRNLPGYRKDSAQIKK